MEKKRQLDSGKPFSFIYFIDKCMLHDESLIITTKNLDLELVTNSLH
jgi:hypothetical protein